MTCKVKAEGRIETLGWMQPLRRGFPHFWVRLRAEVSIYEALHGFMPRESSTDAPFVLRLLIETYRRDIVEGYESQPK